MKTIEERAKEYAETRCINVESELHKGLLIYAFSSSYFQGATEQKQIDIDKAYEWLRARNVLTDASLEGFRKAMEE